MIDERESWWVEILLILICAVVVLAFMYWVGAVAEGGGLFGLDSF